MNLVKFGIIVKQKNWMDIFNITKWRMTEDGSWLRMFWMLLLKSCFDVLPFFLNLLFFAVMGSRNVFCKQFVIVIFADFENSPPIASRIS